MRAESGAPQHTEDPARAPEARGLHIALLSRSVIAHHLGGMETHGEALRRWLVNAGHRVTTITTPLPEGPAIIEDTWGVTRYLAGGRPGAYSRAWGALLVEDLLAIHGRDPLDVIASQSAAAFPYLARRAHLPPQLCIPTVVMSHGTIATALPAHAREVWRHPAHTLLKRLPEDLRIWWNDHQHIPLADHITVLSEADMAAICLMFRISGDRVSVIPNGVDTATFMPSDAMRARARARLSLADGDIAVAIVARLEPRKGQHVTLNALTHPLLRDAERPVKLVLIGDGPSRDALRRQAERLGLAGRVLFVGAVPHGEVATWLNGMDIVALSSLDEAMPLSLLEAMACGRAVVATRVGAVERVMHDGVTGLLVPPNDPIALAQAVDRLARDPGFAQALGARARADAVTHRDASQTMRRYEEALRRVAARAR
ncbi:MAG TPA: glycosyltransferase family 4 protein [Ktedonobacterales bacterium]|nr:glycosyltransferase family 4 protein [Ktedonobacterales bacterium]